MDTTLIRENKTYNALFYVTLLLVHLILYYILGFIWFMEFAVFSFLGARLIIVKAHDWIYLVLIFVGVTVTEALILCYQHEASYTAPVICILIHNGAGICFLCLQRERQSQEQKQRPGLPDSDRATIRFSDPTRARPDGLLRHVLAPQKIRIFSRAVEKEYAWLTEILESSFSVLGFYIGNSNYQDFFREASRCDFAILYHSKSRGRVNITDVTDSLYDQELEHLSQTLGKRRVVVVVDDLDDSSRETRDRILEKQPSISRLGQDLFLFTRHDKQSPNLRSKVEPLVKLIRSA